MASNTTAATTTLMEDSFVGEIIHSNNEQVANETSLPEKRTTFSMSPFAWIVEAIHQTGAEKSCYVCTMDNGGKPEEEVNLEDQSPLYRKLFTEYSHPHFEGVYITKVMEEHVTKVYYEEGEQQAYDVLDMHLKAREKADQVKYIYFVHNEFATRQEYTRYMISCIKFDEEKEETLQVQPTAAQVMEEFLTSKTMEEIMAPVSIYEERILQTFAKYKKLLQKYRKEQEEKQKVVEELAENVTAWSHILFSKPNQRNQDSINAYVNERNGQLKTLVPEFGIYRRFTTQLKKIDIWTKFIRMAEDTHILAGPSVTANHNIPLLTLEETFNFGYNTFQQLQLE